MRLIFFAVLSIFLMVMDHRQHSFVKIRTTLSMVVAPLQYIVDWPVRMFYVLEEGVKKQEALVRENAHLNVELLLSKAQIQKYTVLEKENLQLRSLLKSTPQIPGKVVVARILAIDSIPFAHQLVLDKGTRDGVYRGQPVLDGNGVMGQVVQVGDITSRVLLITDTQSALPIQISRTGLRGIAKGIGDWRQLKLANMPKTADIRVGDMLVTSGLDLRYPEGYPVGKIIKVKNDPGESFTTVEVVPSAYLDRGRLVLLVWPDKKDQKLAQRVLQEQEAATTKKTSGEHVKSIKQ